MKLCFTHKGRLTGLGTLACGLIAMALIGYTLFLAESRWLGILSIVLALVVLGFASLSNAAASIGLPPPFTNDPLGWRAAKKSYDQATDEPERVKSEEDLPKP